MNRFINVLFVSKDLELCKEFKSLLVSEGTNLLFAKTLDEAKNIVSKKLVGIVFIDSQVTCFYDNKDNCKGIMLDFIRSSVNAELITLFLTPDLDQFAPFVLSLKDGLCDFISLPLRASVLNVKIEVYKRMFFEAQRGIALMKSNFPAMIIDELRRKGKVVPKRYKNAVIMFTDFVGFSKKSANLQPMTMVHQLEKYFTRFDDICERYKIEKIKTIGDAYMTVAGVSENLPLPEVRTCLAANEIINFVENENAIMRARGEEGWQIRIGINSGNLVGGIVGRTKLVYDVWGDAVNIAARAEQSSTPGEVLITQRIFSVVSSYFNCTFFNTVEIKKRGGMVDFYTLNRINSQFSTDKWGIYPNNELLNKSGLLTIDFYRMRQYVLHLLKTSLPEEMIYHSIGRTLKIDKIVKEYGNLEALPKRDILILRTAALYHDIGYIVDFKENEQYAVLMAQNTLPNYGYSPEDIDKVCQLIWITTRKNTPNSLLEKLICDANSDYIGRSDYHVVAKTLRKELALINTIDMTDLEWIDYQLNYLQYEHRYYSDLAKNIREKGKNKRIEELIKARKELVSTNSNPAPKEIL